MKIQPQIAARSAAICVHPESVAVFEAVRVPPLSMSLGGVEIEGVEMDDKKPGGDPVQKVIDFLGVEYESHIRDVLLPEAAAVVAERNALLEGTLLKAERMLEALDIYKQSPAFSPLEKSASEKALLLAVTVEECLLLFYEFLGDDMYSVEALEKAMSLAGDSLENWRLCFENSCEGSPQMVICVQALAGLLSKVEEV